MSLSEAPYVGHYRISNARNCDRLSMSARLHHHESAGTLWRQISNTCESGGRSAPSSCSSKYSRQIPSPPAIPRPRSSRSRSSSSGRRTASHPSQPCSVMRCSSLVQLYGPHTWPSLSCRPPQRHSCVSASIKTHRSIGGSSSVSVTNPAMLSGAKSGCWKNRPLKGENPSTGILVRYSCEVISTLKPAKQ